MPDQFAHYLFARRVWAALEEKTRERINPASVAFRCGSFGPDPLFNDLNPQRRAEGFRMHHRSGAEALEHMRGAVQRRLPAAAEYMAGFFCHYALDRSCHPDILMRAARGDAPHVAMETAYDRMLMRRTDDPDIPRRIFLTEDVCRAAAIMYRTVSPRQFRSDVNAFWKIRRMLIFGGGTKLAALAGKLNSGWEGVIPKREPTPEILAAMEALDRLIDESVEPVARQLEKCFEAFDHGRPLDSWLDADFSGHPCESMESAAGE